MSKGAGPGFPVVLTADRVLTAEYPTLLDGMLAASQTTAVNETVMRYLVAPRLATVGVRARKAPLGLRLLEAALLEDGFGAEEVTIVPPERLEDAIGPATRVVLVSSGDPLGLGMNDSTMVGIDGGRPYNQVWFEALCASLRHLRLKHDGFKIIAGGAGAWQLAQRPEEAKRLGLDAVFLGYGETQIPRLVKDMLAGKPLERFQVASAMEAPAPSKGVPAVRGPTTMGIVEISRGCGLGCSFCTLSSEPMRHMPLEKVVQDVETNVSGGASSVSLVSEDFLRYGSNGSALSAGKLLSLAEAVRRIQGLRIIQLDHVNVSSAARFPKEALSELFATLTRGTRHRFLWLNIGIETVSGELLEHSAGGGKLHPFATADWEAACRQALENLLAAGFTPMLSLMLGLPGESEKDLEKTAAFIERLDEKPLVAFPLLYAPLSAAEKPFLASDMTASHWRLLERCYALNFRNLPRMYWDNQRAAGVPVARRLLVQSAGRIKAFQWKLRLRSLAGKAKA